MKNITAKQESLSNWREEISVNEAKIDDVKYGKGKGWDQPENKRVDSYKSRHSYLKKNPPNVRSDRNKRHSEQDVLWHGHDYTERKRKKKHFDGRNVKTTNTPESDKKKKNKKDIGEDVQSTVKKVLDRGTEFVEKNPVGKVLGAIVAPVNKNKGKNYPTQAGQQATIDKNKNK